MALYLASLLPAISLGEDLLTDLLVSFSVQKVGVGLKLLDDDVVTEVAIRFLQKVSSTGWLSQYLLPSQYFAISFPNVN